MNVPLCAVPAILFVAASVCSGTFAQDKTVIAHRGASGYLPEHTLEAYAMAVAQGADYVEPDLVMTKDGVLICLHDIHLESTTDVEEKFPDRKRVDGRWYAIDFTWAEIRELGAHERTRNRFPRENSSFKVPTFAEMIELIRGLEQTTGRTIGIYPELKAPAWHRDAGQPMEKALLQILNRYGYATDSDPVFIQCFEPEPLQTIRRDLESSLKLVLLIGGEESAERHLSPTGLDDVATYADGIGPSKSLIEANPAVVEWAHERGLVVHPYTFRFDDVPADYASFQDELERFFYVYNVDGLFTDFPDRVTYFLRDRNGDSTPKP